MIVEYRSAGERAEILQREFRSILREPISFISLDRCPGPETLLPFAKVLVLNAWLFKPGLIIPAMARGKPLPTGHHGL